DTPDSSDPAVQSLAVIKRIANSHRVCYFAERPFRCQRSRYRLPIRTCELQPEVGRRRGIGPTPTQVRTSMATTEGGHASASPGGAAATFADFLRRVCAGDEAAATELVQRYEPALRLEVQLRLTDPKLRRLLDPADLCPSGLKSFFIRASTGEFELDSQEKLLALLRAMARNKVAHEARKQKAMRRDLRRDVSLGERDLLATDPSPSRLVIGRELLEAFRSRLSAEERQIAELRS